MMAVILSTLRVLGIILVIVAVAAAVMLLIMTVYALVYPLVCGAFERWCDWFDERTCR